MSESFSIRVAQESDVLTLNRLIDSSVRGLQANDYSPVQIELALRKVFGVDSQLIADGTYLVAETEASEIVGCGGWSKRKTLYGGDVWAAREDSLLNPAKDAAKVRAFFIHPNWARRGIGTLILEACEKAATAAGFLALKWARPLPASRFMRPGATRQLKIWKFRWVRGSRSRSCGWKNESPLSERGTYQTVWHLQCAGARALNTSAGPRSRLYGTRIRHVLVIEGR